MFHAFFFERIPCFMLELIGNFNCRGRIALLVDLPSSATVFGQTWKTLLAWPFSLLLLQEVGGVPQLHRLQLWVLRQLRRWRLWCCEYLLHIASFPLIIHFLVYSSSPSNHVFRYSLHIIIVLYSGARCHPLFAAWECSSTLLTGAKASWKRKGSFGSTLTRAGSVRGANPLVLLEGVEVRWTICELCASETMCGELCACETMSHELCLFDVMCENYACLWQLCLWKLCGCDELCATGVMYQLCLFDVMLICACGVYFIV